VLITSRRSLLVGLGASLLAAPAIVRAGSLMKVKTFAPATGVMSIRGYGIWQLSIGDLVMMSNNEFRIISVAYTGDNYGCHTDIDAVPVQKKHILPKEPTT
jgi:hypothetical protein